MTLINKDIQHKLKEKDQDMLKIMQRKYGKRKTMYILGRKMPDIYNGLCAACRIKVFNDPSLDFKTYCNDCQSLINKELGNYIK